MFRACSIAIVVPALNEADKIGQTLRAVPAFVDWTIVVDDGSSDGTAQAARAAARPGGKHLDVIAHPQNRGVGAALATGYARALELGADAVAVMAGDGQMDPADLPRLLAPIVDGSADYAKGNRLAWPGGWRQMPPVRLLGSLALSWLTQLATGYRGIFDSQCGYTVASRAALQAIGPRCLYPRYGYPNDLLARLAAVGARVVDVPVRPIYGPAWRSGLRPSRVAAPLTGILLRAFAGRLRRLGRVRPPAHLEGPP